MATPAPDTRPRQQAPEATPHLHSPVEELEAAEASALGSSAEPVAAGELPEGSFLDALDFLKRWAARLAPEP